MTGTHIEKVARHCDAAGIKADSPLRAVLLTVAEQIETVEASLVKMDNAIAGVHVVTPQGMIDLEMAAVRGADRRVAGLARAHNLRTLLLLSAGSLALAILAAGIGFWGGRASVYQTERRLLVAFRDGAGSANVWATIMEQNDITAAIALCSGSRVFISQAGRKACSVPLYIDRR